MTTDVKKIAKTTGHTEGEIQLIKNYIFIDEHDLGESGIKRFEPDYMMGESWRRLMEGKPEPHDLTLINHEIMERKLINRGLSQEEAHIQHQLSIITIRRRASIMVKLINLKKNNTTVECDILPEDSAKYGHVVVNLNSGELESYSLPMGYEWCMNHVHHAKRNLLEIAKEETLPKEKLVMWN